MIDPRQISPEDFNYPLPEDRIAKYPLQERDESKLVIYDHGKITETRFTHIDSFLPQDSLILVNETRVVHARLKFQKETGAAIEIFCLEPILPEADMQHAFSCTGPVTWKCLIGNAKKWKTGKLKTSVSAEGDDFDLFALKKESIGEAYLVEFSWNKEDITFSEVLQYAGLVPLPPYLNREAEEQDDLRYQTVFARNEGSVAAPTAGLHMTERVIKKLKNKGISFEAVTLHVSAGTFKPVSAPNIGMHEMHSENIRVNRHFLETLINQRPGHVVATGTTTLRTIESLYWLGTRYLKDKRLHNHHISQWEPYQYQEKHLPSYQEAYRGLLNYMQNKDMEAINASTQLIIVPGYRIQVADYLTTNFHMPKSTLLMLVAACIGEGWKKVYEYAMHNEFRFLSYGDGCLFRIERG